MQSKKPNRTKSAKRQAKLGVKTKVLRLRIKDKHAAFFLGQSREVNMVWNYSQALSMQVLQRTGKFMSSYDMADYTKGVGKEGLSLHSQTVQAVSEEYCTRRRQFKKAKLRWRVSRGSKRSLGWVPVKASALLYRNGQLHYQGKALSLWDSYGLANYALRSGNFSEDARGRWYLNVTVDVKIPPPSTGKGALGIDLGLKDFAACSDGFKVEAQQIYRGAEKALAKAQRAKKKRRVKAIHAQVANRRKDFLHKLSTRLVQMHGAIFVGNVSASKLAKTKLAKSVLDAGWSSFRTMLKYKCDYAAVWFDEVDESYSTQECSVCHERTGPKGSQGLSVRQWECSVCNTLHDRDLNAATNIRERGLAMMNISKTGKEVGIDSVLSKGVSSLAIPGVGYDPLVAGIPGL